VAAKEVIPANSGHAPATEFSLPDLVAVIWADRWLVLIITVIATASAVIATLAMEKQYQATVTFSPVSNTPGTGALGGLGSLASSFGGLASLAGISLSGDAKKNEALAVLQSEALTEDYIRANNLLPILFSKKWDPVGKHWKPTDPEKIPTLWKANIFFKSIRSVVTDPKTSLVTFSITWKDPKLAAKWANDIVRLTNDTLREQAIAEAERNIAYLTEQAAKTDQVGARTAIYSILQSEINKSMLARGNADYALKVLDPAFVPEIKSSPKLSLWGPIGLVGGLMLSLFLVFLRNEWRTARLRRG
jgi:capsular polysaccharide biosynthesis protein